MLPPDSERRRAFLRRAGSVSRRTASALGLAALFATSGCYTTGDGTDPPPDNFYYPVGLVVSPGGNVLYVANSDFDLKYNGGTLQSYDLTMIRTHATLTIANPNDPHLSLVYGPTTLPDGGNPCPSNVPVYKADGSRQVLGETCAPPVQSQVYVRDSVTIGAFATDMILSKWGTRLFTPVRGNASVTWGDVVYDDPAATTLPDNLFTIDCGTRVAGRCDALHEAGTNPNDNSRLLTMPGEPFGIAESDDATSLVITHQTEDETSLFTTGFPSLPKPNVPITVSDQAHALTSVEAPQMQFILSNLPQGGIGIASIPHDALAVGCPAGTFTGPTCGPRASFFETNRTSAEIDLLRYYPDDHSSTLPRPFLEEENKFVLTTNAGGTDTRGIVIDRSPRDVCALGVKPADPTATPPRTDADVNNEMIACAQLPARVFAASRSPASLLIGQVGGPSVLNDGSYDPDRLIMTANLPVVQGPSSVYLAPIVDANGHYALRVFVVCFDSSVIVVYDPDTEMVENTIHVGAGPYALAFDPFTPDDISHRSLVPQSSERARTAPANGDVPAVVLPELKAYRYAYVASFTDSFVQVVDLDNSRADKSTFEQVVFTMSPPTIPEGSEGSQ